MSAKNNLESKQSDDDSESYTDERYELWWLILHVRSVMYKARVADLARYNITPEQAAAMYLIKTIGPRVTPAQISRWMVREPHSISGLLQRMEKEGLIRKDKDLERKNLVRVTLTQKGENIYFQSAKRESIHRIMSVISDEECKELRAGLKKLGEKALEEVNLAKKPRFSI